MSAMNVYLDSRDLIGVLRDSRPVDIEGLRLALDASGARLVYNWPIWEVAKTDDLLESRRRFQVLASLPHTYVLGMPHLLREEFVAAISTFQAGGSEVAPVVPRENTWHRITKRRGVFDHQDMLVNNTLSDQIVNIMIYQPHLLPNREAKLQAFMHEVTADRAAART